MSDYRQPISKLIGVDEKRRRECQEAPRKHEEETAASLGGRRQRGSGCAPGHKGDVTGIEAGVFDFLSECKTTQGVSLRLQAEWLNKITTEARGGKRLPLLSVRFRKDVLDMLASARQRKTGEPVVTAEEDWVLIPQSVMEAMLWELRSGNGDTE
jgi:Holliday junction resolvase